MGIGVGNGTNLVIADAGIVTIGDSAGNQLFLSKVAGLYQIGDIGPFLNGSKIDIDDVAETITATADNGFLTTDPGGGAGAWKLGKVTAGAVVVDAANYVEVDIDGVIVKLLKAA
jgi:hypothetical protein